MQRMCCLDATAYDNSGLHLKQQGRQHMREGAGGPVPGNPGFHPWRQAPGMGWQESRCVRQSHTETLLPDLRVLCR